ncbi:MAG: deaminase domain-containing protein [Clostridium saudiense]|uniref:deaminase domain-containing protein n=1 Tax=Clostridium saudiense TaxID=1414720 RepID=UPI0039967629
MQIKDKKNKRIKISNIDDLNKELKLKGYNLEISDYDKFKEGFIKTFNISNELFNKIYKTINEESISYKVSDINDFIRYIKNITIFEYEHKKLCEKISKMKRLHIDRVEYDRIPSTQDDVEHILKVIEETKKFISKKINDEGKRKLEFLEEEINKDYVYAKDIELLKRMLIFNNENVNEEYDENNQIKTLFIEVPEEIGFAYVKAEKGTVEYHQHIKSYIPRMKRLIKNLDKYIIEEEKGTVEYHQHIKSYIPRMKRLIKNLDKYIIEEEKGTFKINQSIAIQDSVNMAVALFNDMEFRAVSGKNDIENSCTLIPLGQDYFKSCKVNKLGKLGIGYNRVNDSEKKIIEEIHKLITKGKLKAEGDFTLYSKWEPCPSCYYVISQFIEKYPKINLKVMYYKEYGEK